MIAPSPSGACGSSRRPNHSAFSREEVQDMSVCFRQARFARELPVDGERVAWWEWVAD